MCHHSCHLNTNNIFDVPVDFFDYMDKEYRSSMQNDLFYVCYTTCYASVKLLLNYKHFLPNQK